MVLLRFTSRFSLIPGLRVNLNKRGASLSVGQREHGHHKKELSRIQ
jgi:hypothetical protein